jgi:hypothetical protein
MNATVEAEQELERMVGWLTAHFISEDDMINFLPGSR